MRCQPGGKYVATLVRSTKEKCFFGGGLTVEMAERGGSTIRNTSRLLGSAAGGVAMWDSTVVDSLFGLLAPIISGL